MKLQLKKVYFSEHMSEETNAFTADIYFNNKKIAYVKNDGHGGCNNIQMYEGQRSQMYEAEVYAKTLPSIDTGLTKGVGGEPYIIESDLDVQVDEMFNAWLEKKTITKESNKGIYHIKKDGKKYLRTWNISIAKMKNHPQGPSYIQTALDKIVSEGGTILNTNLQGFKF
tara:strand:- start:19223 stop:19729 length:507 start_codon:yes stop_codon:yes gene_type:complete